MILRADVCKHIAREALKGRWWSTAMTGFVASLLGSFTNMFTGVLKLTAVAAIFIYFFEGVPFYHELTLLATFMIAVIWLFVGSFVRLGYLDFNLSLLDKRGSSEGTLFGASAVWWNSIELRIYIFLMTAIASIFFVIPGIIVFYNYAMAPFLLEEKKNMTVEEALKLSKEKMKGNRGKYFSLRLSFLGWKLLGFLTLGIGFLFINPYYSMAETVFFNEASGRAEALYDRT